MDLITLCRAHGASSSGRRVACVYPAADVLRDLAGVLRAGNSVVPPGRLFAEMVSRHSRQRQVRHGISPQPAGRGGLVAGHVLIAIPWTVRLITASLVGMDRAVEEAAQSLGADRLITFRRITLPAILPGIVAAALFGFIASFGNLEMSLFLGGAMLLTDRFVDIGRVV